MKTLEQLEKEQKLQKRFTDTLEWVQGVFPRSPKLELLSPTLTLSTSKINGDTDVQVIEVKFNEVEKYTVKLAKDLCICEVQNDEDGRICGSSSTALGDYLEQDKLDLLKAALLDVCKADYLIKLEDFARKSRFYEEDIKKLLG